MFGPAPVSYAGTTRPKWICAALSDDRERKDRGHYEWKILFREVRLQKLDNINLSDIIRNIYTLKALT